MPKEAKKIANKILAKFFGQPNPLDESETSGDLKLRFDSTKFKTKDEKGECVIWLFPFSSEELEKKYNNYFRFYISINISIYANDSIRNVNIRVYKDAPYKTVEEGFISTELLLRAEWSNEKPKEDAKHKHAQPHWHIHSYKMEELKIDSIHKEDKQTIEKLMQESIARANPLNTSVTNSTLSETKIPMLKFHLAMVADWDIKIDSAVGKELTNEALKQWLPQCLEYIREQLEYILSRLS